MIPSALYQSPVPLDPTLHRSLRMSVLSDYSIAAGMHAAVITATEFGQAAFEFPILFVDTADRSLGGADVLMAPVALMGLSQGENLHVQGTRWDARYIPAFVRRFPFLTAELPGSATPGVLIEPSWSGFSQTEGAPLFGDAGQPAPALQQALQFLELFEAEARRTRAFCARVVELGLLKEMKADATLPGGEKLSVDGFQVVDEDKLRELPDAVVLELHRNGILMLLQVHLLSLGNMRQLLDRKARRTSEAAAVTA